MAAKKENRRMVDMLERMGLIEREKDEPAVTAPMGDAEPSVPVILPAAPAAPVEPAAAVAPHAGVAPQALTAEPPQTAEPDAPRQPPAEREVYVQPAPTYEKRAAAVGLSSLGENFWDDTPAAPESVERFMDIDELYRLFQMKVSGVDTVYLLEEYIKTLPDSLPADLRRNIIVRIVQASGFDFDRLLSDGIDRVSRLNDYAAEFASRTDTIVTQQNDTIADLERQIELVRAVINERKNLHKKQFLSIENEAQRLKKILDFITK